MSGNSASNLKQLSVVLGEDAWQGDADAVVTVDGVVVFQGAVTASEQSAGQQIALGSFDGTVDHKISVQFTNDAYGGTSSTDRNLYVKDVLVNGATTGQSQALYSNGSATFDVAATAVVAAPVASSGTTVLGSGPDTIQFSISEDAWQGDAQYIVLVDGQQVGGVQTATASHASGQDQLLDVDGSFTAAPHTFGVQFVNDAYGGSSSQDRNLYVDAVAVDGVNQNMSQAEYMNGVANFSLQAPAVTASGSQTIQVVASEDAYQGDAVMVVSVDGVQVGDPILVTASHAAGATQTFSVSGNFGPGSHTVSAAFVNDAYGGSSSLDRNLYVQSVSMDGVALAGASGPLYSNGAVTGSFTSTAAAPVSTPTTPVTTAPAAAAAVVAPPTPPAVIGADSTVGLIPVGTPVYAAGSPIETVGVGKEFSSIGAAVAAATDGTVILVDAGTYTNDFATNLAKVTLIAVGGRVEDVATVPPPNFKGLITTENDLTVEGFDFSGVRIPDAEGHNGAGIRDDNGNLVIENDSFSQNQDGILTNSGGYSITIDHSVFNDNGGNDGNGAGNIHNVYIGAIASVTATNSIFENAQVGHEFKSRAAANTITNNQFISGVGIGTGSYDIDLPDGGKDTVTDNTIVKGPNAENHAMVHFGGEGIPYAGSSLTLTGNLFQADNNPSAVAVLNQTAITTQVTGNVFQNISTGAIAQGPATLNDNFDANGNSLQNAQLVGVLPGSTDIITDNLAHTVVFYGGLVQAAQGGTGRLTVVAQAGHVIAIGGSGGMDVTEGANSGGNQWTTAAGSTNVLDLRQGIDGDSIDSEGNDTILAGNSNQSGQLNGNAVVADGAGSDYWSVGGTAKIDTGSGSTFVNLGATATVAITGTNDFFELSSNGGTASWNTTNAGMAVVGSASVGAFSFQAYDGGVNVSTTSGAGGAILHLDQGNAQVISLGADTIYAGSGNDTVIVSGAAKVYAGSGTLSVYGHADAGGADVYGQGGDYLISGDSGGITYHGGALASTVEAQLSSITLIGGAGQLTINGGSRDTVTGGAGGLVYNDFGNGANTVSTATGSTSVLNLSGIDQVTSRGNDTITLDSGSSNFALYGNSSLTLEAGNSYADLEGTDTVTTLSGTDYFNVDAGAAVSVTSSNFDTINEAGATLAVAFTDPGAGGAVSSVNVSGPGSASVTTNPGSGITVAASGNGPVAITTNDQATVTSAGNASIHFGGGASNVALSGNGNEVWAGSGSLAVNENGGAGGNFILHGGAGAVALNLGSSHATFIGGSGSATLNGGVLDIVGGSGSITASQNYGVHVNSFVGGSGSAYLSLDSNGADLTFGTGQSTIHDLGWGGADTFHFLAGMHGTDTIQNFRIGTDHAVLGAGVSITSASVGSGSAQFALSDGAHVTFAGLTTTQNVFGA